MHNAMTQIPGRSYIQNVPEVRIVVEPCECLMKRPFICIPVSKSVLPILKFLHIPVLERRKP